MSARDWIQPGVKVAIYSPRRFGRQRDTVTYDTVARVLKRDIVLESGRRFAYARHYSESPEERGLAGSYLPTPYLLPPDHLRVRQAETDGKEQERRIYVNRAAESFAADPTIERADKLIAAVEAWKAIQPGATDD